MENENEYAQEEVVEQEEQTSEELLDQDDSQTIEEDVVTLTKSEFNKLNRRAIAYEANKKTEKPLTKVANEINISPERLDRIELLQDGYSKDEVDAIMDLGGTKMLNNPIVQNAIKVLRQERKSKDVSQNLSSKSPVYKKFTQDDLNNMSSAELEKIIK
jgi:hypothetical protein